MFVSTDLINGISLGLEYVAAMYDEDDGELIEPQTIIFDLVIIRFLFQWG